MDYDGLLQQLMNATESMLQHADSEKWDDFAIACDTQRGLLKSIFPLPKQFVPSDSFVRLLVDCNTLQDQITHAIDGHKNVVELKLAKLRQQQKASTAYKQSE